MHTFTYTHKHTNTLAQTQIDTHIHTGTHYAVTHTHALTHAHARTHTHGAGGRDEGAMKWAELLTFVCVCVCHVYLCVYVDCILDVRTSAYVHVSFFVSFYMCMCVFALCLIL